MNRMDLRRRFRDGIVWSQITGLNPRRANKQFWRGSRSETKPIQLATYRADAASLVGHRFKSSLCIGGLWLSFGSSRHYPRIADLRRGLGRLSVTPCSWPTVGRLDAARPRQPICVTEQPMAPVDKTPTGARQQRYSADRQGFLG